MFTCKIINGDLWNNLPNMGYFCHIGCMRRHSVLIVILWYETVFHSTATAKETKEAKKMQDKFSDTFIIHSVPYL